jgi:hypothetical protein
MLCPYSQGFFKKISPNITAWEGKLGYRASIIPKT